MARIICTDLIKDLIEGALTWWIAFIVFSMMIILPLGVIIWLISRFL